MGKEIKIRTKYNQKISKKDKNKKWEQNLKEKKNSRQREIYRVLIEKIAES